MIEKKIEPVRANIGFTVGNTFGFNADGLYGTAGDSFFLNTQNIPVAYHDSAPTAVNDRLYEFNHGWLFNTAELNMPQLNQNDYDPDGDPIAAPVITYNGSGGPGSIGFSYTANAGGQTSNSATVGAVVLNQPPGKTMYMPYHKTQTQTVWNVVGYEPEGDGFTNSMAYTSPSATIAILQYQSVWGATYIGYNPPPGQVLMTSEDTGSGTPMPVYHNFRIDVPWSVTDAYDAASSGIIHFVATADPNFRWNVVETAADFNTWYGPQTNGNVLANDYSPDNDALQVASYVILPGSAAGAFTLGSDGAYTFLPDDPYEFVEKGFKVSYVAADTHGNTGTSVLDIELHTLKPGQGVGYLGTSVVNGTKYSGLGTYSNGLDKIGVWIGSDGAHLYFGVGSVNKISVSGGLATVESGSPHQLWLDSQSSIVLKPSVSMTHAILNSINGNIPAVSAETVRLSAGGNIGAVNATQVFRVQAGGNVTSVTATKNVYTVSAGNDLGQVTASDGFVVSATAGRDIAGVTSSKWINTVSAGRDITSEVKASDGGIGVDGGGGVHSLGGVSAGRDILEKVSATGAISQVSAGRNIDGAIETTGGTEAHIYRVVATLGHIQDSIHAGGSIGSVQAGTTIFGGIKGQNIGRVKSGELITGAIEAVLNVGGVLAGTDLMGKVTAGQSIVMVAAGTAVVNNQSSGSISNSVISAGTSIGSVSALHTIGSTSTTGGHVTVSGGITATAGYIGSVTATRSLTANITAVDNINTVTAGTFVNGNINSSAGSILTVSAGTGRVEGSIDAGLNIGPVTAYTDRLGMTKAGGSIGNITATTGKIDGNIEAVTGLGNVTAGTSILQEIKTTGPGASAGKIRAGADTAGSIIGKIDIKGNIQSVIATDVKDEDLPTGAGTKANSDIEFQPDGTLKKLDRLVLQLPDPYSQGNILGGIKAGGGIFDVLAHGRIANDIYADGEIKRVLAYKNITSDITSKLGGSTITSYGEMRGDISIPGSTTVWAYDDISGTIKIASGGLTATTWASFISEGETEANGELDVWAYDKVTASLIKSDTASTSVTAQDDINANISAQVSATVRGGNDVAGRVITQSMDAILRAGRNWGADIEAAGKVRGQIAGALRASVVAGADIKMSEESISNDLIQGKSVYLMVTESVKSNVVATHGAIVIEAGAVLDSRLEANTSDPHIVEGEIIGKAVIVEVFGSVPDPQNSHGDISNTTITTRGAVDVYATGTVGDNAFVNAAGDINVVGIHGIRGYFISNSGAGAGGDVSAVSWDGITGNFVSWEGRASVTGYGNLDAVVQGALRVDVTIWGDIAGTIKLNSAFPGGIGKAINVFARNDVLANIEGVNAYTTEVNVDAGGAISGHVSMTMPAGVRPESWDEPGKVNLRAMGDISGGVSAFGAILVVGDTVTNHYSTAEGSVDIFAMGNFDGRVSAASDVQVHALGNISASGEASAQNSGQELPQRDTAGIASRDGSVTVVAFREIAGTSVFAGAGITAVAATGIDGFNGNGGASSTISSLSTITGTSLNVRAGDISANAGGSAELGLTATSGGIKVAAVGDLEGTFATSGDVLAFSFGSAHDISATGDHVAVFGQHHADAILTGGSSALLWSIYGVSGSLDASTSIVIAGHDSSATVESGKKSTVIAGYAVSGSVKSKGSATAVSESRGSTSGGVSAVVEGRQGATAITLGGSITGKVESSAGSALAFAGMDISSPLIKGKTAAAAVAIHNISGGEVKSDGPATATAFGNIESSVTSELAFAMVVAGDNVTGAVKASQNAIVAAVSGIMSGTVQSINSSAIVVGVDGVSGAITAHRHAIALSLGAISGAVTANNGSAIVVSVAGGVSGAIDAGGYAVVISFDSVTGKVTADKSILVASLADVTGEIDAEEYAIVLAAGGVTGSSVTAGKSALVVSLGNVTSGVTAEDGSVLVVALGNVNNTASATEIVAVIALGDVKISVPQAQDLIVISGGDTEYKYAPPEGAAASSSGTEIGASASRDIVLVGMGSVKGNVSSGRDAVLVTMGPFSSNVTAAGDAVVFSFDGISAPGPNSMPSISAGGDAIVISGAGAKANVTGGKNAILVTFDSASESVVTASQFAALLTGGTGNAVNVIGNEGAFAWTYGNFSGNVTSSAGSAVVASIGNATNATIHGADDAIAFTVGSFSGNVTSDNEYVGIISLLNASGTLQAGKGAVILSDGSVNVTATADEDLLIWARGDVHGSYSAGRDAAVVSQGTYDASLTADNDIVFAYGRNGIHGSLTAGRWIGDGGTSVPMDPAEIDDVFSHGDIMAQIVAGTSASTDSDKGRIGTIGSIGNAGGSYSASHINRIRTAGVVTAGLNVGGVAFDSGSASGSGVVIQENQSTLITDVPVPNLDPSERDEILADAATDRDAAEADRLEVIVDLEANRGALQIIRQMILGQITTLRESIRTATDILQQTIDDAVDAAQQAAEADIQVARDRIESSHRQEETQYLQWQTMAELERDLKRNEMEVIRLEVLELRRKALAVFDARDAVAAHNQTVVFLAQEALCWDHILRAKKAIYDREQADAQWWEDVQDSIQTRLDYAGFIPILGAGPDLLNALISAKRGDAGGFTLSVAAALPFWGDSVKATAMAAKNADEAVAAVNVFARNPGSLDDLAETLGRFKKGDHLFANGLKKALAESADDAAEFWPEFSGLLKESADTLADPNGPFARTVQKQMTGVDKHSELFGQALAEYRRQINIVLESVVDDGVDAAKKKHGPEFLSVLKKLMDQALDPEVAAKTGATAAAAGERELMLILKRFHDLFGV
ncbi:MAG: hypothetical protein WKF77_00470 [Planctomycetaceae bacterium]